MIRLKIKISKEAKKYSNIEFLPDDFPVCKNSKLQEIVSKHISESTIQEPEEVKIIADFEW